MDSQTIEREAADWLARRVSGSWTPGDEAALDGWLAQSTAHRVTFIRLEVAWERCERLTALGAGVPAGAIPVRGSWGDARYSKGAGAISADGGMQSASGRKRWGLSWVGLAASLFVAIGVYPLVSSLWDGDRYVTKTGALETVSLADGSRVTLNTDSGIRVELAERQRLIKLERGEAFFDVAQDPRRPFVVAAGSKRVVAVGTKFSVRRDHDGIVVAVTEGKVKVEDSGAPQSGRGADVLVGTNSVARTSRADVLVHDHAGPEIDQLLSWRRGYLAFRDVTLAEAVAEFNRYNTRKMVIQDEAIADLRIGGNFRSSNTDAFLWLLQNGFPVTIEQDSDRIVLKAR